LGGRKRRQGVRPGHPSSPGNAATKAAKNYGACILTQSKKRNDEPPSPRGKGDVPKKKRGMGGCVKEVALVPTYPGKKRKT